MPAARTTAVLLALLVTLPGCRPTAEPPPLPTPVKGKVMLSPSQPLRGGVVTFRPVGDVTDRRYQGWGFVKPDGTFEVVSVGNGVAPGDYVVTVSPKEEGEPKTSNANMIPRKYRAQETTPLKFEVKADRDNVCDINLGA